MGIGNIFQSGNVFQPGLERRLYPRVLPRRFLLPGNAESLAAFPQTLSANS